MYLFPMRQIAFKPGSVKLPVQNYNLNFGICSCHQCGKKYFIHINLYLEAVGAGGVHVHGLVLARQLQRETDMTRP
jgi:hypothetical protein